MEENTNQNETGNVNEAPRRSVSPLWVGVVVFLCFAAVAVGFIVQQQKVANQLSARNEELTASLTQTKGQVQSLSSELNTLQTQQAAQAEQERVQKAAHEAALRRAHAYHRAPAKKVVNRDDPRWKQVQAELAAHQKAIDSTQQDLQNTRSELQGNLDSTRNELNGSIAKTHAELVELEKKGERNYYEFDMFKAKHFERVGPIEVSLRKTNAKHQFCDLHVIVNDRELVKKHINVYEPVVFYTEETGQPMQLVINSISKNHMHGYVSAPKYQGSQMSAANTATAPETSTSATGAAAGQPAVVDLRHRPATANAQ
jgi:cell division protein FtsL